MSNILHDNTGATEHTPWCDSEHDDIQMGCFSPGVEIGPLGLWLTQRDDGNVEVVMDTPRAGVTLSIDQADELSDAIQSLLRAVREGSPVQWTPAEPIQR